jgi:hypothetical protein
LLEAAQSIWVIGERSRQNFDGDIAIEPGIGSSIDFAHSTGAERTEDSESA